MAGHVCPWWGGYFIDNRLRRWVHNPEQILGPYLREGMTAMDVGCGMGMFSIAMARLVGERGQVIAVDLQPQMLAVLMKRAQAAGVAKRVRPHPCTATSLVISEPVDFALAFYSAHEIPDQRRLLEEVHRCMRPGGQFLIVEPKGHVTARHFASMVACAADIGWTVHDHPRVRLSRAIVLVKEAK